MDKLKKKDPNAGEERGALQAHAASVLMKVLYAARLARFDLLKAIAALASKIDKWDCACDKRLHRLMCYVNSSLSHRLKGYIGDDIKELKLGLYTDADFASCKETSRSTTGIFLTLEGPHTFFPLNAVSKKQNVVSHSTPEAEIVAADAALRVEGIPGLTLWDTLSNNKFDLIMFEDNQATLQILKTGKNPTVRHLNRTHRVDLAWLAERFKEDPHIDMKYCVTSEQCADILTKAFTKLVKWAHACKVMGIVDKRFDSKNGWYGPDVKIRCEPRVKDPAPVNKQSKSNKSGGRGDMIMLCSPIAESSQACVRHPHVAHPPTRARVRSRSHGGPKHRVPLSQFCVDPWGRGS